MKPILSLGPRAQSASARARRRGLTLFELLWLVLLGALMTWAILGSVENELADTRASLARDTLEYLSGMLSLGLEDRYPAPEALPLAGPGELPEGLSRAPRGSLADYLPEDAYLPEDPWGRAYVLVSIAENRTLQQFVLLSGGGDGQVIHPDPEAEPADSDFAVYFLVARPDA